MTTNARITTHDWPVQVTHIDIDQTTGAIVGATKGVVIPPNTESLGHEAPMWQGRAILLTELPLPGKIRMEVDDPRQTTSQT